MSKPKHIIFAVTNDLVTDQRVHRHIQTLLHANVQIRLVGRKLKKSLTYSSKGFQHNRFKLLFNSGFLFYAEYNLRLFFFLLFRKIDMVVANDLDTLLASYLASKIKGIQLVYDSHELFTEVPELIDRPRTKRIWEAIEKSILPSLKYVLTVSESIVDYYSEKYKIEVQLIRNFPMQYHAIRGGEKNQLPSEHYLIYQGALNKGRGIELMIQCMQFLKTHQLLIAGEGDLSVSLRKLVYDLGLVERIIFLGRINMEDLWFYTKHADLGLSFEEDLGLNYRYALPNKLFDYIQAHIPVLVSDLPEMRKIVEEFEVGEVLKSRTPIEIVKQIEIILSEKQQKYKTKSAEVSTILCWEKESEKLKTFYKRLSIEF